MIDFKNSLEKILKGQDLSHAEMFSVMQQVMAGELTPEQIAGLLVG
ncbi:MAG TPA: anthranilate phosphoribosyltransferase, partial [Methylophilaceae bacterium]|nr:anthranilate phosphoribosyltransferase [Methylophilaceae bacterium]